MLWLPTTEAQASPWAEDWISSQKTRSEHADIDTESTHSSDATVVLGGPEAVGHPKDPVYGNQDRLTALTREINDLCERVAAGEGQPAETLDCIQCELQNLLVAIHQPHTTAPAEPLGDVVWQYTDTLCTMQKQSNLTLITARYTCF